jgi:hypothetical protein
MGDVDDHVAWLRQRKAVAEQDVEDDIAGARHVVNVTQTLLARAQTDILQFETLATCEPHNN